MFHFIYVLILTRLMYISIGTVLLFLASVILLGTEKVLKCQITSVLIGKRLQGESPLAYSTSAPPRCVIYIAAMIFKKCISGLVVIPLNCSWLPVALGIKLKI